ncbi:hypothetical protein PGT21_036470 [Puccinia graminis f. sp. tritici]|uniref:ABC transporter domain-containing protein n=1 Tax=Puccinia graminis f. sp. tritici TaxID=56615 RepID=A0A5B0MJV0_PUCGR|nr:hypothetical protein PGTUg99_037600 [Puccinia graminis f. sp. tritici]KAA1091642.1 hypothetical protein PGT21_036470 [Puccinia graminis f. sp. tritici]
MASSSAPDLSIIPALGGSIPPQSSASDETKKQIQGDDERKRSHESLKEILNEDEVDVEQAERTFAELRRQLTEASSLHLAQEGKTDAEKQDPDATFDLLAYLRGNAQSRDENGMRPKHLGVIYENLSVVGNGGIKLPIITFFDALRNLILAPAMPVIRRMLMPPPKTILHPMSGCVKSGEMCMVLGRPNSGCTTFLKVIANQRVGFKSVDGNVTYGGIPADVMTKRYKGEVVYNPEDDIHHPTLTVYQTLKFALRTKTPGKLLPSVTRAQFADQVLDVLLKMLGISHTKNTLVGDAHVRGVSGGERKRVSIAEMMATRACVLSWDNSTRGLDASTALSYAKSLRIMTNIFQTTMFVTLYQAGEGIYDQFDKILLLNEGRCVYFGPTKAARDYMVSLGYKNLPRQTTADYLTGCTDENERQFQDDIDVTQVPKTPEEMEQAYLNSSTYQTMEQERIDYNKFLIQEQRFQRDFMEAVKVDQGKGVNPKSPYTVSIFAQLRALIIRSMQLTWQDRQSLVFDMATVIVLGIVQGTVFLNLPTTTAGIFTRGGTIFLGLLMNVFLAFTELPKQMLGRPIMWRQTSFCFYRPGALAMAGAIAEIPFSFPKVFVFSVITYLMPHLVRDAGAFFTYVIVVYMGYYCMGAFYRFLGAISFDFDTASRLAATMTILISTYSGYMISKSNMPNWLRWIYHINPANYAFAALMANEFGRVDFTCSGASIVPRGDGYPSVLGSNQVCTVIGARPGSEIVRGVDYMEAALGFHYGNIWRDFAIVCAFCVLFLAMVFIAVENLALGSGAPSVNVFAKENAERKALNEKLQAEKAQSRSGKKTLKVSGGSDKRLPFTWEALSYDVPVPGGQRRLLNDIYGYVKPGTLTALMGSSGAGKTTLLDVLANRKTIGVVSGDICIGGRKPGAAFQRGTAYCEQQDVHEWTATVREAMRFSAHLRQPYDVSVDEKNAYVEEVIQLLELEDLADAMIGFPGFGLGVEARKRLTIGVELAARPELLLFLDEPTSGLDGQSAYNIVRFLRKLASAGQAILCTIHQPNALLFENFDRLLLLKKGGRCVYFGDIGQDSKVICSYFARNGAVCPDDANPAEFMLEAIGAGNSSPMGGSKDWADRWLESPEHEENKQQIIRFKEEALKVNPHSHDEAKELTYATPFSYQLKLVINRTNLSFFRNANYEVTRVFNHLAVALITGLTYLNLPSTVIGIQYRIFAMFELVVLLPLIMAQVEPVFIFARQIYIRESSAKMYSPVAFGISQTIAEMPYSLACSVGFFLIWYFLPSFQLDSSRAGYAFLMVVVVELFAVTGGQAVAAVSPSLFIAVKANPFFVVIFSLFCGVTVPKPDIPKFWRKWMYDLNPLTRVVSGLIANEMHGLEVTCSAEEYAVFQPPSGQSCVQWAGAFIQRSGGYLLDPNATSGCQYCQYRVGDEFMAGLELDFGNRYRDLGILIGFICSNVIIIALGSHYLTHIYAKR